jgi:hypothetical protein
VNQPLKGPQTALEQYAEAWRNRSSDELGAVLAADYTAHSYDNDFREFVDGSARQTEMAFAEHLLRGVVRDGHQVTPPADTVQLYVDGVSENPDPEHPDSSDCYRVLVVRRFQMHLVAGKIVYNTNSPLNIFHVVRADAAILADGQAATPDRWYIRRFIEDVRGVDRALADRPGNCGEEPPPSAPAAAHANLPHPLALAIHALTNPACATLELRCDLPTADPAQVEVYDVTGRLVNHREVRVAAPGVMTIAAGEGASLLPGAYWVRLRQADRPAITRMVVVAK